MPHRHAGRTSLTRVESLESRRLLASNDINGATINDTNRDGVYDSGDGRFRSGVVYLDLNNNAQLDTGEPQRNTGLTGDFSFTGLTYYTLYHVRFAAPAGYVGVSHLEVTPQPGQIGFHNFLGYDSAASMKFRVGVFNDSNANGAFDGSETRTSGITVYRDANNNGTLDAAEDRAVTDVYGFADLVVRDLGQVVIRQQLAPGQAATAGPLTYSLDRFEGNTYLGTPLGYRLVPAVVNPTYNVDLSRPTATFDLINTTTVGAIGQLGVSLTNLDTNTRYTFGTIGVNTTSTGSSQFRVTVSFSNINAGLLPDGRWQIQLPKSIATTNGETLASDFLFTFTVLRGDANRDGVVNFDDLLIVAQNYGQTGRTFTQGNFDYSADGAVGFDDLLMLAQRYGTSTSTAIATTTGVPSRRKVKPTLD